MNLTRRLFSALIPAAPAGAMIARSGLGSPVNPTPAPPIDMYTHPGSALKESLLTRGMKEVAPPAYKKYREAQEAISVMRLHRYRRNELMRGYERVDLNIQVLKSVSKQHKLHMHLKQQDDERKQEQSFMSALAESLGLKEYLEKKNILEGVSQPAATTGGW